MNISAELVRFAATGRLDVFEVGVHLHDVVAVHGEPHYGQRIGADRWPHRFGYGDLDAAWCRCRRLWSLTVPTWRDEPEVPGPGPGETSLLPVPVTESGLTAALTAAGVAFETEYRASLPDQRSLVTRPAPDRSVYFLFTGRLHPEDELARDWPLHSFGTGGSDHAECPEPDRSLPDDGYGLDT
ncbi:hypothetical protein [Streptomyces sp. NPDC089799]|uniref:hypothetical protein n=1 Tax=Streptomyces sp. NPDC089799 TaxID=3155066 RepID=UPI0034141215